MGRFWLVRVIDYAANTAWNYTQRLFPKTYNVNDCSADAYRHAFWNALAVSKLMKEWRIGRGLARQWVMEAATAHEAFSQNPTQRKAMDLYNNLQGRALGADYWNSSEQGLSANVLAILGRGTLRILDPRSGCHLRSASTRAWYGPMMKSFNGDWYWGITNGSALAY